MDAEGARQCGKIDIRIADCCPDLSILDVAAVARGHGQETNKFLVIGTIVVHYLENRDAMVGGCPQRARHEHKIAVALDSDGEPPMVLIGKCGA
jgi:hypothetical protein